MSESNQGEPSGSSNDSNRRPAKSPMVFISHDSRDAALAEAFGRLLTSVSAGVLKSFRSSDRKGSQGIEYGVEWYPELMRKLDSASDVVCLLTPRSIDRPWLLYEAGVAKGKLETPVFGVALGVPLGDANSGPFAQFQNCDDNEESLTKLVMQLLQRVPGSEPDRDAVLMQVASFKARVPELVGSVPAREESLEGGAEPAAVAKLFEEVKVMFQDLPARVESRIAESVPASMRRSRRMHRHAAKFGEMFHRSMMDSDTDFTALLVVASTFRDDVPWMYELLMDVYRDLKDGSPGRARDAVARLRRSLMTMSRGPWADEVLHPREMEFFSMELPMLLDRILEKPVLRFNRRIRADGFQNEPVTGTAAQATLTGPDPK